MDNKALYNLSYGVFLLGTKESPADSSSCKNPQGLNACITNTCFQTANSPTRIAISVIKQNLTCQMIEKSGVFTLSVLDSTCDFNTIKHFGYQTGRDTDKFTDFDFKIAANGCPYIQKNACSLIEAKVCAKLDLQTHMLFVAEVTDATVLSSNPPLTYADYQNKVKPNNSTEKNASSNTTESSKKIVGWRCKICGYEYQGSDLPPDFLCPLCGHPVEDFEPIFE